MHNKPYTTPVWWLSIVLFVKTALTVFVVVTFWKISHTEQLIFEYYRLLIRNNLISLGGYGVVIVAEAVVYWKLRYNRLKPGLVWIHIAGWVVAIIGIPLLNVMASYWLAGQYPAEAAQTRMNALSSIQFGLMWGALIIGHLCFAMALVDVYKRSKEMANRSHDKSSNSPDGDWVAELHDLVD